MVNYSKSLFVALVSLCCLQSVSLLQAQAIKTNLNQKVIYTDSLNLPRQTSINTMLTMMSELLQRPGATIYSNYDIQVNGMSVSDASEVALYQLGLQDVESIIITDSPTSSYLKNGQGGSINLVLRQKDNNDDGYWGSIGFDIAYPVDYSPQLHLGYRSQKFYISALALSDISHNTSTSENLTFVDDKIKEISTSSSERKYRSQLANVMMEYHPTSKDVLKLSLSESYMYDKKTDATDHDDDAAAQNKVHNTNLKAKASYGHAFLRSNLNVEAQFNYNPGTQTNYTPKVLDLDADLDMYNVAGKVEYVARLLKPANPHLLQTGMGASFNYTFGDREIDYNVLKYTASVTKNIDSHNHTSFIQPFVYAEAKVGTFRMKMQGEYQIYRYKIYNNDESFDATSRDLTGQMIVEWHFKPGHALRLVGARVLQRPSESQLFPFMVYNPTGLSYMKGNAELTPALTNEIRLDYIADQHWGEHQLHYDVNVSYKYVHDMIEQTTLGGHSSEGGLGALQKYQTYLNNGKNNIVSGNIMALYSYKTFSVSLTGNIFHNKQEMLSGTDHYTYYNVSLNPHFILKDGWQGSFGLTYNSSVKTENSTLSDCTQVSMLIGKRWRNLYVYTLVRQALKKNATNSKWYDNIREDYNYEMVPNMAAIGVKYLF